MTSNKLIKELKELANPEKAKHSERFFKTGPGKYGEGDKFLGITVPSQRKIAKKYRELTLNEVEKLLQNGYHEIRLTAAMLLVYKIEKHNNQVEEVAGCYLKNISGINNWDIVDSSCHQILGRFLENKERTLLYNFAQSDDLWKKRIAMITCLHFIKKK